MMHRPTLLLSIATLTSAAFFYAAADPLDGVFTHIDSAAKSFKGISGDISNTHHWSAVNSDDVQNGTFKVLRIKAGLTRLWIDWKGDTGTETMTLDGHDVRIYDHKPNIVNIYAIGDNQSLVNQYLSLGFGANSTELKATYDVTYVGEEKIGDQQTSRLQLVPKAAETRRHLKQADLWYTVSGLVTQQKFLFPDGDYKLVKYSNTKLGAMDEKDLELKAPKNAAIQKH